MSEGPDAWCYDALTARSWGDGDDDAQVSILRTLEVVWTYFHPHPLMYSVCISGTQPLEELLTGTPAVATSPEVLMALREHVLVARVPGRSTYIEVRVAVIRRGGPPAEHPDAPRLVSLSWRVDGVSPATCDGGRESVDTSCFGLAPDSARRRVLSKPGRHRLVVSATVQPPGVKAGMMPWAKLELKVEVRAHEATVVSLELDVSVMPPVLTRLT